MKIIIIKVKTKNKKEKNDKLKLIAEQNFLLYKINSKNYQILWKKWKNIISDAFGSVWTGHARNRTEKYRFGSVSDRTENRLSTKIKPVWRPDRAGSNRFYFPFSKSSKAPNMPDSTIKTFKKYYQKSGCADSDANTDAATVSEVTTLCPNTTATPRMCAHRRHVSWIPPFFPIPSPYDTN